MTDKEKRRAELITELEKTSVVGSFTKVGQLIREIEEIDNIEWDYEKGRYVSRGLNIVDLPCNL